MRKRPFIYAACAVALFIILFWVVSPDFSLPKFFGYCILGQHETLPYFCGGLGSPCTPHNECMW